MNRVLRALKKFFKDCVLRLRRINRTLQTNLMKRCGVVSPNLIVLC